MTTGYEDTTSPDANGCRFFAASFTRVKQVHRCIERKLSDSASWQRSLLFGRTLRRKITAQYSGETVAVDAEPVPLDREEDALLRRCLKSGCKTYDTLRRADEIIKSVSFKD